MAAAYVKSSGWEPPERIEKDELIRIFDGSVRPNRLEPEGGIPRGYEMPCLGSSPFNLTRLLNIASAGYANYCRFKN